MTARRLRIQHLVIQPVLVWDDGEELTPGPALRAVTVPLSQAAGLIEGFPAEVAALAAQIAEADEAATQEEGVTAS